MGKYYVAGIPFDSENSLKHYGVKGMEWNKHKFGIDADDRYIKWLKNAGQNIGKFTTNAAQNVAKGATTAAKTVGTAVNKGANFVGSTANQAGKWAGQQAKNVGKTVSNAANQTSKWAGQQAQNAGKAIGTAAGNASKWANQAAQDAGKAIGTAAGNAGNWANQQARNVGNFVDQNITGNSARQAAEMYSRTAQNPNIDSVQRAMNQRAAENASSRAGNTLFGRVGNAANTVGQAAQNVGNTVGQAAQNVGDWAKGAAQKAADVALWPATREGVANAARNVGNAVSGAAQNVGNTVSQAAQGVKDYVDYNITGKGYDRDLNAIKEDIAANPNSFGYNGGTGYVSKTSGDVYVPKNSQDAQEYFEREAAKGKANSLFGRVENAAQGVGNVVSDAANDVGNWAGNAAQNVGNAVSGAANKATEGAKGFLNSSGQWVSGAANNVKNTASKAASDAKKGASGFINSAGQWVSNAAGNVKNAAQNVGNTVGQAAQNVGNAVGQAAQNVGNTVGQAAEQARGGIGGLFDRVGNAVGGAANAVGNWAGNAAKDVGNAVGGAAQNVGNWAGNAAKDVGNAVTGAANAVGDWAGQAAQNVSGAVQNAGQAVANVPQNIANWYTGNDAKQKAQEQRELGNLNQQYGNALMDAARNGNWNSEENRLGAWDEGMRNYLEGDGQLRAADQYMDMYNNAPRQRITSGLQDAANAVGQAAQNVGGAANAVGDWVGDRVTDARDAITAPARQNEWNQLTARNQAIRDENDRKFNELGGWSGDGRDISAYNPNSGYMLESDLQKSWDQYHNNVRDINQHPVSSAVNYAAGNVADWARNAAGNVGNAVSGAAGNVADWARNTAGNVGNWAGQAAQNVGNAAKGAYQFLDDIRNAETNAKIQAATQRMADDYKQYLQEHPEYPSSPQHSEWLREQNQQLMEQLRSDPHLRAYYEQYMSHSALDKKPDGVSDAFWEKFTADGGTREEYDRDWR